MPDSNDVLIDVEMYISICSNKLKQQHCQHYNRAADLQFIQAIQFITLTKLGNLYKAEACSQSGCANSY